MSEDERAARTALFSVRSRYTTELEPFPTGHSIGRVEVTNDCSGVKHA
ncbi:hypothetical protein J3B00_000358 [Pseudomonas sp. BP8]|nr:hypothetical protein [Pseudomonas sp. BP8]